MSTQSATVTSMLKSLIKDGRKSYHVYDGNKLIELYEGVSEAEAGDPCLVTYYSYDANNNIQYISEEISVWQVAYDKP